MERKKKLIYAILIILLIGFIAMVISSIFFNNGADLLQGNKNVLVCAVDESEKRPGMGAIDMAYIITMENGTVTHYTPVYPHGMRHPTKAEPTAALSTGARDNAGKMLLHDALWYNDTDQGIQNAKEIVEYNKNVSLDAVVLVDVEAIDAIIKAAGPLDINGTPTVVNGLDFVREEQSTDGATRGQAVITVVQGLIEAAQQPALRNRMVQMAYTQYNKGNIVVWPKGAFVDLIYTKGLESITNN